MDHDGGGCDAQWAGRKQKFQENPKISEEMSKNVQKFPKNFPKISQKFPKNFYLKKVFFNFLTVIQPTVR
jgi:hypothetical protein